MQILVEGIHYTYPDGVKALNGVSLAIRLGEKVALVGENGSGKTTLARHLNGLLRPQAGQVVVGDWRTAEHSPAQMARRVAYVFQNPDEQLFRQRVWEEVAFGPQNLGYPGGQVRTLVGEALERMGLSEVSQVNPRDLGSSGRKRVAVASALAMQTPVLVFDEPTAGLDARELEQMGQVIAALHQEGRTVLMISHDMDFVAETMDRVVLMRQGQIGLDAPVQQAFSQAGLLDASSGESSFMAPQITRLSQRLGHERLALNVDQFLQNISSTTSSNVSTG